MAFYLFSEKEMNFVFSSVRCSYKWKKAN